MIGVIFGPPGSGKGTQAALIQSEFDLSHLSTGEILRTEAARGSSVGREAARIMAAGDLVPDPLMVRIVRRRLQTGNGRSGVLLDGFPRTVAQAKALDAMLGKDGRRVDFVVALEAPESVLVGRLLHRAKVEGRSDDTLEAITERMHEYRARTAEVLTHYRGEGVRVEEVDGTGPVEAVFERVREAVGI